MKKVARFSVGTRLALVQAALIVILLGLFTLSLQTYIAHRLERRAENDLSQQLSLLVDCFSSYHSAIADSSGKLVQVFRTYFPGSFSVNPAKTIAIGDKQTPALSAGSTVLNLNTEIVDRFTGVTKAVGTIFVRSGDDFVRISTSLKKEDGSRAIGTILDRKHPAYQGLLKGEAFVGKASLFGKDFMTAYNPVKDGQGRVIAVLFVGLDFTDSLKALKDKIRNFKNGETGYFFALDAKEGKDQGMLQIHPFKEGTNIIDMKDSDGREFIKSMVTTKEGVIHYPWVNREAGESFPRKKLAVYRHLKEWNWVVVMAASVDELNSEARIFRNAMLAAMVVVAFVLVLVLIYLQQRWISKPLRTALDTTNLLGSGDFSHVSNADGEQTDSADEIVQISQGINRMGCELRQVLEKISCASQEVSAAAGQVSASAERIATGAEEVATQAATVATADEEMSATSGDIAQNCLLAADGARKALDSARNGAGVVDSTLQVMCQIAEKVRESASTIEGLGERSDQIGAIIGTIQDIADQTNLLALNAAIEAARAGEQGRGFAVVADEVRALAERTTRATQEIGGMIKAIQMETKGAVAVMEQGVHQVEAGTGEATKSGAALRDILDQVNAVASQINQIATAAEEQTATTSEISSNMQQITEVVHDTSREAQESATAASQLLGNAEELQRLVQHFKL
ncbi:MAG: Cache 3/Cache 2 fusion domain-containing protein [Desulfuromonadales bacterium]|nr:Cache 3/Cache 2 fusion domain-containing protein [Desulfuromonadales bacterium]